MASGIALFIDGETKYEAGQLPEAFELYRQAVVQIVNHEDVLQKLPVIGEEFPEEILVCVWQNLVGCFRQDGRGFTQEAYPDGYDLVYSFRPTSSSKAHPQFKGPQGRRVLKAMEITAALTLGLLAHDQHDRSTAAKRYQEGLDVAATHPPFNAVTSGQKHLNKVIAREVQQMRDNLAELVKNDTINAAMVGSGQGVLRKDVLNTPHTRIGHNGADNDGRHLCRSHRRVRKGEMQQAGRRLQTLQCLYENCIL
ncbi:hypothetical protein MVEN_01518900 [Mycena venus]|uniref:Uncharacterized protein n=1 Tax=Mycena venus TaxID=2733690 RepID=A0A8H7CRK9_9AGAR|nr:hypothetical protein MVEN_01518900 [Mycena venus]